MLKCNFNKVEKQFFEKRSVLTFFEIYAIYDMIRNLKVRYVKNYLSDNEL